MVIFASELEFDSGLAVYNLCRPYGAPLYCYGLPTLPRGANLCRAYGAGASVRRGSQF